MLRIFFTTLSFLVAFAGVSNAATVTPCDPSIAGAISPNAGCQYGTTHSDFQNPLQVNVDAMFGTTNWTLVAKDDDVDGVNDAGANVLNFLLSGNSQTGTWSIDPNAFSTFSKLMIVLKGSASGSTTPTTYVGYLLSSTSGTYFSPFAGSKGQIQDISHVSLYGVVPLPAAGAMMLGGVALLGFVGRRRRNAA